MAAESGRRRRKEPSAARPPTSSTVSSWGVAALSSESFWEPIVTSPLLRTSRLFLCLWASFFTWPSALPLLSRRTGLVSHFRRVLPWKNETQRRQTQFFAARGAEAREPSAGGGARVNLPGRLGPGEAWEPMP